MHITHHQVWTEVILNQSIPINRTQKPQIAHQQSLEIKNSTKPPISKVKRVLAIPGEPLEVGFEWTDAYYDPDQLEEPGYREKVMEHLHAKHYYETPQRQMPPFQQSLDLLARLSLFGSKTNYFRG